MDVDRLEALADAEQENADHDQRHQDREGDADLHHQRHALRAGGGEDQPVLDRQEADHLAHGIAPRDHHQQAEQDHRKRKGEVLARQRAGLRRDRQHDHDRQRDQRHAGEHRQTDADHRLDRAMDAQAQHDAVQREGNDRRLDDERDRRSDVEVRRILDIGLPGHRNRHHQRVQGEGIDEPGHAGLVEEHQADEHQPAGEEVGDVEGERAHHATRETNRSRIASTPSISAAPRKSETRKTRILAIAVSNTASIRPAAASFAAYAARPARYAARPCPETAIPQGAKRQGITETYSSSLTKEAASMSARCLPEYSRIIASCTMVSSRCVAGLSTGMRAFSASATMTSATSASASETRRPTPGPCMKAAIGESCVEPASSATVNTTISIAGSASEAIIISRLEPMAPKLVPTSSPASASRKRALPSRATIAIMSAAWLKSRPGAKVGTSAAATPGGAKTREGAAGKNPEAEGASSTSL